MMENHPKIILYIFNHHVWMNHLLMGSYRPTFILYVYKSFITGLSPIGPHLFCTFRWIYKSAVHSQPFVITLHWIRRWRRRCPRDRNHTWRNGRKFRDFCRKKNNNNFLGEGRVKREIERFGGRFLFTTNLKS